MAEIKEQYDLPIINTNTGFENYAWIYPFLLLPLYSAVRYSKKNKAFSLILLP